jgi:hypothetical protein
MRTQYQVSKSDFKILISILKMLKGGKCEINRQSVIRSSGVSESTLRQKINNVYLKENILKEKK